jgi:hypothetical protein
MYSNYTLKNLYLNYTSETIGTISGPHAATTKNPRYLTYTPQTIGTIFSPHAATTNS